MRYLVNEIYVPTSSKTEVRISVQCAISLHSDRAPECDAVT
jgi:hypothetical protein